MKSFLAFAKSPVGKLHTTFSLFILFNLLSGFVNLFIHYTPWLVGIHFYTGLLIVIAPLAFLLVSKNRKIAFSALRKMAFPGRADFKKGKRGKLPLKAVTLLAVLLIFVSAVTGIFMKFRLWPIGAYNIHTFDFKALLALVTLHAALGAALRAKRANRPKGARQIAHGSNQDI